VDTKKAQKVLTTLGWKEVIPAYSDQVNDATEL